MNPKQIVAILLVALSAPLSLSAQSFRLLLNKESGVYDKGERAVIMCHMDSLTADSITVRVAVNNQLQREERLLPQHQAFALFDAAIDSTCAVSLEVSGKGAPEGIGFVVAPEGFRAGYEEPADLMDYWNNQKALLRALPMQVKKTTLEVPEQYQGKFVCDDIEINCLGPAPVRAYMAKPVKAQKGSLPIVILCRAAGVSGAWCRCQVGECVGNAALGNGALSLDLNAHGMLNGQHDDYYRMLENGPLHNYYDHNAADRETYYFRGMYLRLLRAIEFMTQQPEWDGKRILVIGESQGGGQAVAAAGLDSRVTAVVLNVPAMQDFGGARLGRRGGWPHPIESHKDLSADMLDATLPYFDGALLIRHSKAEIYCEIGLIDTTCPPSAVWSSLNGAPGPKTVNCVPFRTHAWPSGRLRPYWEEHFLHPREQFIANYLK
jgi:cephalosporin-C deacetylase-like acetyl esterase